MSANAIFWIVFIAVLFILVYLDKKYYIFRCDSAAIKKPYSFARVQTGWWTLIVLSSFITIIIACHSIPTFDQSTLILLGISSGTLAVARLIDQPANANSVAAIPAPPVNGENFFLDILSDDNRVRMSRFQTVAFNLVFGCWFIASVLHNLGDVTVIDVSKIMPVIEDRNLILIGLSSGTYAALKTTENKTETPATPLASPTPPQNDIADVPPVG